MLRLLRRFFALPGADRWLVLRAVCLVVRVRLSLSLLPSRLLLRQVSRQLEHAASKSSFSTLHPERIVWAVRAASQRVPQATCLTQALAAQLLLAHYGHASRLRLGVARGEQGRLVAHAWVESGGRLVIGGQELDRYALLPDLDIISRDDCTRVSGSP